MIHFIIDLKPVPKARPRFNFKTKSTYTPAKTSQFESHIKFHAQCVCQRPLEGALEVDVKFNFVKAKTNKKAMHTQRPDLDNLLKGVLDALNGVAFLDDCQIVKLSSEKKFSEKDSIEILINELN